MKRDDSCYDDLNPVLNSPQDITPELLHKIATNQLQSLTLNYEFAPPLPADGYFSEEEAIQCNPFRLANATIAPIRRIDYMIKLGSHITSLAGAFQGLQALEYVNLPDTAQITNMSYMFSEANSFNQPLGHLDTSKVTNMACLFHKAEAFNQPIETWNTAQVSDMHGMFSEATAFNQPLNAWNTANVTDMGCMFSGATSFNQPLSKWNTSKVTIMGLMFAHAKAFNQPLDTWDTANVIDMTYMFYGATAFKQSLKNWQMAKVAYAWCMFDDKKSITHSMAHFWKRIKEFVCRTLQK